MIDAAYAMGQTGDGASGFASFIPLILMFVIFYFLLIRPQQKRNKEHRQMIENLRIGDRVVLGGGIHGRITNVSEDTLMVEVADKVKVKANRSSVSAMLKSTSSSDATDKAEQNKK